MTNEQESRPPVLTRGPELLVAAVLMVLAALCVADSIRVGTGWASDGPRAGYFPFFIGLGLGGVSATLMVQQLLRWRADRREFVEVAQAASVWAVLWPTVLYTLLIAPMGIYASSVLLIVYFMRRHGHYAWWRSAAVALGVMALLFATFEIWFMVPLPKGPLEALFGL
ncbi:MAG: tripartite tricarboxylate transporter TctB family protein [Vitreoscilla sp.]|nr:tripartite tricarboxylate transporter TctB family protein [Burkholderiales bacterium]MBP6337439.1 tripartite tricarboxylate transporter TctB family protein [Vitreoscilla sp.]MBP6675950.1 tripartite tricarboxylate transporter TctB family protein [Vitreoscilla sp.]